VITYQYAARVCHVELEVLAVKFVLVRRMLLNVDALVLWKLDVYAPIITMMVLCDYKSEIINLWFGSDPVQPNNVFEALEFF
jgi:hypothetical protein